MDESDNPAAGGMTRATPENQQETETGILRDHTPAISHSCEMKRWSGPCGDVGRPAEMTGPSPERRHQAIGNRFQRNSLSGRRTAPGESDLFSTPANNGETPHSKSRAIPWEVESNELFDPVTTEAKAEMAYLPKGKSTCAIRRRPSSSRIHMPSYISGYVDGEGCFCVSLRPQPRIRIGWEVRPSFSVSQNGDRSELIMLLPHVFACGSIRPDRSDKTLKFEVRSLKQLAGNIIPFFDLFPLLSSKREDFELFRTVCQVMVDGQHLRPEGLFEIAGLAEQMNGGVRRYSSDMVRATVR
jgi:hypothetical protein